MSLVCNAIYVEDVEDRSNTPKGCNAMYVEDARRWEKNIQGTFLSLTFLIWYHLNVMLSYVEDVEDRSNIPKGCNAMYVGDVEDGQR